jgi:hypothetical protein
VLFKDDMVAKSAPGSQLVLNANAELKTDGDATIDAMKIEASGKTQASLKVGGSSVQASPAGVDVAGAMVNVNGNAMVSVSAPVVKIG